MRVAIVHDWLETYAGAERTLEQMLHCFPQADVFAVVDFMSDEDRSFLKGKAVKTTFIQKLPFAKKHFRKFVNLMPLAIEQLDLSGYQLIISSSHAVSKGVITGPNQLHICYCYTPMRYAWELSHNYISQKSATFFLKRICAQYLLHKLRLWDVISANRPDHIIGISDYISRRIQKHWRRGACTIYPPVDTTSFKYNDGLREEYYITCSRLVPYKRIDLIVETFTTLLPSKKLLIVGDGPQFKQISNIAGKNVQMLGFLGGEEKKELLANSKAFVFAAEEDFGIAPLEAQASGTPVIAFKKGGSVETIVGDDEEKRTGVFFNYQTPQSLASAVASFEKVEKDILPMNCRNNAERFSKEAFRERFWNYVNKRVKDFDNF